jgi:calcineurin-like phosphoesterase family protein
MEKNWRATVPPGEHVLHLGDVGWRKGDWDVPKNLPGRIHVIPGNHDSDKDLRQLESNGWEILPGSFSWQQTYFSHRPIVEIPPGMKLNIHGHIHNNGWEFDSIPPGPRINVSVEVMDYTPVRLADVLAGTAGEHQPGG